MMKWKTFVIGYALALALLLFAQHRPSQPGPAAFTHIVDLTHSISMIRPGMQASDQHALQPMPVSAIEQADRSESNVSAMREFATRIEAPANFAKSLWTVDQIPPERLFAPLVVMDVRAKAEKDADYQLSVADVADWEQAHGGIPQGAVVIARTGWGARWPSMRSYRNADRWSVMHFPGFSLNAARFLVQGRNAVGLGIDTLSTAGGNAANVLVRNYTLSHSVYQIENIANLGQAPESGALVLIAPAKLEGTAGGPVRVFALTK